VGTNLDVLSISAKDIILDVASFEERQFDQLNSMPLKSSTMFIQRLLIIDDLDVIIPDFHDVENSSASSFSNLESEQLRSANAVAKLVDMTIHSSLCNCFIMGIARATLAQLPTQLARVGRFEKEVTMSPPSLGQRRDIFQFWLSTFPTKQSNNEWSDILAPRTAGCVASDIRRICADALTAAVARKSQSLECVRSLNDVLQNTNVEWSDIKEAARSCIPSQLTSMDVIPARLGHQQTDALEEFELAWKDFGGYGDMKMRLFRTVVRPWRHHIMKSDSTNPDTDTPTAASVNVMLESCRPSGLVFHGPAGNGKTHAAMCLAASLGLNCVKVRKATLVSYFIIT
jgi:SpoVK/Ycf46/Vps4 family AAA+-type ATPase